MDIIWAIIVWSVFGLIAGGLARLLVPGRQPIGIGMTILLGVAGSLLGGFLSWFIWGGEPLQASGFILSVLGAVILLAFYVSSVGRRHVV